jgi:hypothetical protein
MGMKLVQGYEICYLGTKIWYPSTYEIFYPAVFLQCVKYRILVDVTDFFESIAEAEETIT